MPCSSCYRSELKPLGWLVDGYKSQAWTIFYMLSLVMSSTDKQSNYEITVFLEKDSKNIPEVVKKPHRLEPRPMLI
jgi:hypothetical protein